MPQGIYPNGNKGLFKKGLTPWNKGIPVPEEQKRRQAKSMKGKLAGEKHPMWGKKHSEEIRKKMSEKCKGSHLGPFTKKHRRNMKLAAKTRKRPPPFTAEHRRHQGESHKGAKSHLWKGGITAINHAIRHSFAYRQWHSDVFTRDNWACVNCQKTNVRFDAHHVKSFASICRKHKIKSLQQGLDCAELWDINNGQTLCVPCHKLTDNYLNKRPRKK